MDGKATPFFQQLTSTQQKYLLQQGTRVKYRTGTTLYYEGEQTNHVYLIQKGKVRLSKMTIDHKTFYLHLKQEDEIVGEFSLFNEMSTSMTAEVVEDAELVCFDRLLLENLFTQNGDIAVQFIKLFARNTQSTQAKFCDLLLYGKTGALYSILIRFNNSFGKNHPDGILIDVKLTNRDIANFIGTSRETANRMLRELEKKEILTQENGWIILHDLNFLKSTLHCGKCPVEICTI
ncbi:Crp/Fnr family transcriptional regulator [Texcoconibacillus texcoconensis]|uniref:CRP/FNR family transcriptional regulator n=1 Tax=Texcoconibacillus texcoconensis TaxID=1095777 RepID=A0A840QU07_9BACI|nr:Crp/Fnr family transcriptional regulator [Texcoconibacillus texcoconensis]MBB5174830.1 CRP/FNR family transcriptional regulator [Texcoconibacillus texcoconensis]